MAATFLPPIVHSPFSKAFARHPYQISHWDRNCSDEAPAFQHHDCQNAAQTSIVPSAPTSPSLASRIKDAARGARWGYQRGHNKASTNCRRRTTSHRLRNRPSQDRQTEAFPSNSDPFIPNEIQHEGLNKGKFIDRSANQLQDWPQRDSQTTASASLQAKQSHETIGHEDSWSPRPGLDRPFGRRVTNLRRWASSFRLGRGSRQRTTQTEVTDEALRVGTICPLLAEVLPAPSHRKRTSNASSRFITTMKTASLSNDSMSLLHPTRRQSRLSDTKLSRNSEPRPSVDSHKPPSLPSADEGSLKRCIMRRQILQEILTSEDSYVADLKALHNLLSTLLLSTPSFTTRTRDSIQQNVTEMLVLHEDIVDEIRRVVPGTISSERQTVTSSPRSMWKRDGEWQGLDAAIRHPFPPKLDRNGACSDPSKVHASGAYIPTVDAIDAAEVARVFRKYMPRFFVYEEYCAKYRIMVQEVAHLHREIPQWSSSCEAGIEALAKSVASLNERAIDNRKGLTTADLLMKPIQRICKYPLLFSDLHRHTPVVDCPNSYSEIEGALGNLRTVVREIDLAADSPHVRDQMQRRWLLRDRIRLGVNTIGPSHFHSLGPPLLCGVLHVTYQTFGRVEGRYMLCVLFKDYLLVASPLANLAKFDIAAVAFLGDVKISSTDDGRGLQCHTAPFSWKILFQSSGLLFELLFSACSATEYHRWLAGIKRGKDLLALERSMSQPSVPGLSTTIFLDTKPVECLGQGGLFPRRVSITRAATIGPRISTCQVILRNTQRPRDGQDMKRPTTRAINRSQSLLTTHRVTLLAPKRSERVRLEQALADIWTRDTLPYPGMYLPRGGNLLRTSAGSLARKLSFASIHGPFSKRSGSLTLVGSRFSHETSLETKNEAEGEVKEDKLLPHETTLGDVNELSEQEGGCVSEKADPAQRNRLSFSAIDRTCLPFRDHFSLDISTGKDDDDDKMTAERLEFGSKFNTSRKRWWWSDQLSISRLKRSLSADGFRRRFLPSSPSPSSLPSSPMME